MKKLTAGLFCLLLVNVLLAQNTNLEWGYDANSINGPVFGRSINSDAAGNVYVAGIYSGTVDFDPGPDSSYLSSNGFSSVFVQKMDKSGKLIWALSFGNSSTNVSSLVVDSADNIYMTGSFGGATIDFDPGSGVFNQTSAGNYDVYVLKLASNGTFIWAKSVGGSDADEAFAMDIDAASNLYLTGSFEGTVDFDPGTATSIHTFNGWMDIFVLKLDRNGEFVWAKTMGGMGRDKGLSIKLGPAGNVHLTGYFSEVVDFDPGTGMFDLVAANAGWASQYSDIFIQTLDTDGNLLWAKRMGAHIKDEGKAITTDPAGNIYVTGRFSGTVDFDPGPDTLNFTYSHDRNHFIQKLDADGNLLWVKLNVEAKSIRTDQWGNLYLTGFFHDTKDLDPGIDSLNLSALASADGFIQKLNPSGELQWVEQLESSDQVTPAAISIDSSGNILLTGTYLGTVDLDPGPDSLFFTHMPPGAFTLKLNQENALAIEKSLPIKGFNLFPNPAQDVVHLKVNGIVPGKIEIVLFDLMGKKILQQEAMGLEMSISLQALSRGWYTAIVMMNGEFIGNAKLARE